MALWPRCKGGEGVERLQGWRPVSQELTQSWGRENVKSWLRRMQTQDRFCKWEQIHQQWLEGRRKCTFRTKREARRANQLTLPNLCWKGLLPGVPQALQVLLPNIPSFPTLFLPDEDLSGSFSVQLWVMITLGSREPTPALNWVWPLRAWLQGHRACGPLVPAMIWSRRGLGRRQS